ncbi:hypothetical protein [Legionella septentrionalis]|uniref:hypothetical protein n=1 Tax=Legionella septentrionalis TaxID=2498109 RepID=UPI000F8E97C1|nr:hypothetical protein [Legionella septentrionalis]RUR11572.1 hypothetical protein ELY14_02155 [Legionella septentrionalis]
MVQTVLADFEVTTSIPKKDLQMEEVHSQIHNIKKHLDAMIDTTYHNSSMIGRWANFWGGEVPLWQKILAGVGFFGTLLALGVLGHLLPLILITVVSAVAYGIISYIFDEHYESARISKDSLKKGIFGLVGVLGGIIENLQQLKIQLSQEVEQFKRENEKLNCSIAELTQQVQLLSQDVQGLAEVQGEFTQLKIAYSQSLARLEEFKTKTAKQIENLKEVTNQLTRISCEISDVYIQDNEHKQMFVMQLQQFVNHGTEEAIKKSEEYILLKQELAVIKKQLQESGTLYEQLNSVSESFFKKYHEELKQLQALKPNDNPVSQVQPFSFMQAPSPRLLQMCAEKEDETVISLNI